MSAAPLVLFDIDGTLLRPCGLGRSSLESAFDRLYAAPTAFDGVRFHGRMDPDIFADGLRRAGQDPVRDYPAALEQYLAGLAQEVRAAESLVLDGVIALLDALSEQSAAHLGLVTGNVPAGAEIKLSKDDLWSRFDFGAFGGEAPTRTELIGLAAERARSRGLEIGQVVYIGDTELDVAAAREAGARAVAVATGGLSYAELAATAPDLLFEDWADTTRALEGLVA